MVDINEQRIAGVADVRWYSPNEGGRRSGPPKFEYTYVAMCQFDQDVNEVANGLRPQVAVSAVFLKQIEPGESPYLIAFATPLLVLPFLRAGAVFHVDEGVPQRSCTATVLELFG